MRPATTIASLLLLLIALGQLIRALSGWTITINAMVVPVWFSFVAAAVFATIGLLSFREALRA